MHDDDEFESDEILISKSQLKREAHALQELGEKLVKLSLADFEKVPMDDSLRDAITAARGMKKNGALKRQLQFIGKLMRKIDATPIQAAYDSVTNHYRDDVKQFHQLENWRDRLITEGDKALGDLLEEFPDVDRQHLRQLIRSASKESAQNKPPRSARELFQYLKTLYDQ
ncbi:MAG: ribosome-associated protein [Gammaproteobacteria bacterium]|nr:ribosome-associated protein [Gammaproteobacteria bacterium]